MFLSIIAEFPLTITKISNNNSKKKGKFFQTNAFCYYYSLLRSQRFFQDTRNFSLFSHLIIEKN